MRTPLRNVYWVAGGSAAGKSTIARRLAAVHGLPLYATDDTMTDHAARTPPEASPLLRRFIAMDVDERWVRRSPEMMLDTFHWFRGECFERIVEDVGELARTTPVIAEGFRLLPHLVDPLLAAPRRGVWLLPTPDFRRAVFEQRGPEWGFLAKTSDPAKALHNLLERDRLFTDRLRGETKRLALTAIEVDGSLTEDALAAQIGDTFGL